MLAFFCAYINILAYKHILMRYGVLRAVCNPVLQAAKNVQKRGAQNPACCWNFLKNACFANQRAYNAVIAKHTGRRKMQTYITLLLLQIVLWSCYAYARTQNNLKNTCTHAVLCYYVVTATQRSNLLNNFYKAHNMQTYNNLQYTCAHSTHNAQQLATLCDELDEFVNNNAVNANVQCSTEEEFLQALAARNVQLTHVQTCAMPVLVYMHNNTYAAWWDEELEYGYIA